MSRTHLPGSEVSTVEIAVRLGERALRELTGPGLPCRRVWLTAQPDGSYALGVVTQTTPEELGLEPRLPEVDDRARRFPDWDGGFDTP